MLEIHIIEYQALIENKTDCMILIPFGKIKHYLFN